MIYCINISYIYYTHIFKYVNMINELFCNSICKNNVTFFKQFIALNIPLCYNDLAIVH